MRLPAYRLSPRKLASFIRSDRQRQLAIALEERQRLVHDLHDSISQKLYGLVALTEAAQASLETGSTVQAAELSALARDARQALKEMRLFLFQMKPVDLENAGLVAALHERLAVVEGGQISRRGCWQMMISTYPWKKKPCYITLHRKR